MLQRLFFVLLFLVIVDQAKSQVALDSKNTLESANNFEALAAFLGKFNGGFELSPAISMSLAHSKTEEYRAAATLSGFQTAATNDRELNTSRLFVPENSSFLIDLSGSHFITDVFKIGKFALSGQAIVAFKPVPKTETEDLSYMTFNARAGGELVVGWLSGYLMHNWLSVPSNVQVYYDYFGADVSSKFKYWTFGVRILTDNFRKTADTTKSDSRVVIDLNAVYNSESMRTFRQNKDEIIFTIRLGVRDAFWGF